MGWVGLAQNTNRAALNYFPNKNALAEVVCVKTERAGVRTNERLSDQFGQESNLISLENNYLRVIRK
jgi:hypothetical protein